MQKITVKDIFHFQSLFLSSISVIGCIVGLFILSFEILHFSCLLSCGNSLVYGIMLFILK